MGKIAILPPELANQIAAGEVIERPASVIKELVENALDADATRVRVALRAGGRDGISVSDDGQGMSREDAVLACVRHSTSKITRAEDLVGVRSFGFRGEALASIAAVADLELLTRRAEDDVATRVRTQRGRIVETATAGGPPGTRVEVRALFANIPARRKFLKRPATEFAHGAEILTRMALGSPRVGITMFHDDREVLDLPPVSAPADRLLQVIGRKAAGDVISLEARSGSVSIEAYLGRPEHSLSSARLVLTYVGGRFVRDRMLTRAIIDGYASALMRGRYPIAVVFIEVAAGDVDVNVHPAKAEVRFRESSFVYRTLAGAIRDRLRAELKNSGQGEDTSGCGLSREPAPAGDSAAAAVIGRPEMAHGFPKAPEPPGGPGSGAAGAGVPLGFQESAVTYSRDEKTRESAPILARAGGRRAQQREVDELAKVAAKNFFGSLRFLGQILTGYLVCESRRGLVLVDQHAAHERIRFEALRSQLGGDGVAQQRLLVPQTLELDRRELEALVDAGAALNDLGFEGEVFGTGCYILRAVPAVLLDADCAGILRDLAAERAELGASRAAQRALDEVLASVACHSAIRFGRRLTDAEAEALLAKMDRVDLAGFCPHGRPAFVEFGVGELERLFKR